MKGTGRLSVTGVDIIQAELDAARDSAEAEGVPLNLVKADLRTYCEKEGFDCAVNLYTSFGYCDTEEEDMLILKNMCDCVKKGGTFILECISRETAILYFTPGEDFERGGMNVHTEFKVSGAWEGLVSKWTLTPISGDSSRKIVHEFTQRLYPAAFLRDKIKSFGFSDVQVYGDFDFSPYDEHARTMIVIGKK